MNDKEYNLSNSKKYNVRIVGGKDVVKLANLPECQNGDTYLCCLIASDGTKVDKQKVEAHKGMMTYCFRRVPAGHYNLQVMKKSTTESNWYVGWLSEIPIVIGCDRTVRFEKSPVYDDNANYFGKMKTDHSTLEQYKKLPRGNNADIIKKAYEITKGCLLDYSKLLAIHDWIADNIYYDLDSYNSNRIDYSKLGNATEVYRRKLAVCAGYSDLAVIMLRAVGIPAYSASCYALGLSTAGHWTSDNIKCTSNHAITMAYIQKRWIIMDITWDSGNKFKNGKFQHTGETEHNYFDPTLQSFSGTHKLCA